MDKRTAKALEASIAHWERNVAAETWMDASVSGEDCALCVEFFGDEAPNCRGCPVAEKTGQTRCDGTPYDDCRAKFIRWLHDSSPSSRSTWRAAAQRELDFLKSLRAEAKE